jgi:hypothetical protein
MTLEPTEKIPIAENKKALPQKINGLSASEA